MPTNTAEVGLENLIVEHLRDNNHYIQGTSTDYNTDYALDTTRIEEFLRATQPQKVAESLAFASPHNKHNFFERLKNEITKRGVIDVLRKGYRYNTHLFDMYSPLPSELNDTAKEQYNKNIFCVIRQLHYSKTLTNLSLDVAVFLNGMPLITFELKNQFTGQNVSNAIKQYRTDRDPKDLIFKFDLKDQISEKEKVISEKNKEISALKKRMHESFFAKIRRALRKLFNK